MISTSFIFLFLFLSLSPLTRSSIAGVARRPEEDSFSTNYHAIPQPSSVTSSQSSRILSSYRDSPGPDGSCHASLMTTIATEPTIGLGKGIAFAVKSDDTNEDGLMITSFGFHIKPSGETDEYELYKLTVDGHYSSERDPDNPKAINETAPNSFDYRGKLEEKWELIANGTISAANLTLSPTTVLLDNNFFQIPVGLFEKVLVPPNGGLRSFYLATRTAGLMYAIPPDSMTLYDELTVTSDDKHAPKILLGEGLASYPMKTSPYNYLPRSFIGSVYYEKECPSTAPSISAPPTDAPNVPSQIPSAQPSRQLSEQPSSVPSEMPSSVPSNVPSILTKKIASGLLSQIVMDCTPGEEFEEIPKADRDRVAETTQLFAAEEGRNAKFPIFKVKATVVAVHCVILQQRHLITDSVHTRGDRNHRHLPSGSSAVDFSVVITGEYSPPFRLGKISQPWEPPDLGEITEDSINRDPIGFAKTLRERSGTASVFAAVEPEDVKVLSFEVDNDFDVANVETVQTRFTWAPSPAPTSSPTITPEDNLTSILIMCIVITSGIILLLSAFLLFRYGERRAAKQRREKMARLEEKKAKDRIGKQRRAAAERANMDMESKQRFAHPPESMAKMHGAQYGYPPHGDPRPPPVNYYASNPQHHSQGYNYSYGGPPHPPPAYGQHYGEPNPEGYHMRPPGQSAHYGQPPKDGRNATWE